ncbi:MAG: peptidoglycan-binding domain-containing protein, partial [bacterium]
MNYPNRIVIKGEVNPKVVKEVQKMLNANGCGPIDVDGDFGNQTFNAVKLFQSRFTDQNGNPLVIDGKIGPLTWASLFGNSNVPSSEPPKSDLVKSILQIASGQVGVMEDPVGSNSGAQVDEYLASVGLNGGYSWCAAF